jgi:hypothetical protein
MTKKDYELIAHIISNDALIVDEQTDPHGLIKQQQKFYAEGFAMRLANGDSKFNTEKFLEACGVAQ